MKKTKVPTRESSYDVVDQLSRVEELVHRLREEKKCALFFSDEYKRDREWWVVGRASKCLSKSGEEHSNYAQPTEPPNADFKTFVQGTFFKHIEIAEVLKDRRRRHQEMKEFCSGKRESMGGNFSPGKDPFQSFRSIIRQKFLKRYGPDCWLLVMLRAMIFERGPDWIDRLKDEVDSWPRTEDSIDITTSPYERILVLGSGGTELVSIYPHWDVIYKNQ